MKNLLFFLFALCGYLPTFAQDSHTTDTDRKWYYPDYVVVQFAGNIGMIAAGPGYSYAKDKMQTDILYGFVPGFEKTTTVHILTAKTSLHPFTVALPKTLVWQPLRVGTGLSYSFGPQFYTSWPKRYPDAYYWWASSLRITPFIGTSLSRNVGSESALVKRLELYAELGTNDLDIVSKLDNKNLPIWDILNIAIGSKLVF